MFTGSHRDVDAGLLLERVRLKRAHDLLMVLLRVGKSGERGCHSQLGGVDRHECIGPH